MTQRSQEGVGSRAAPLEISSVFFSAFQMLTAKEYKGPTTNRKQQIPKMTLNPKYPKQKNY